MAAFLFGSCKSSQDLTEDEVYTILNEIIADDSLSIDKFFWKFQDLKLTEEYKKEFKQEDISFIGRQRDLLKKIKIKPNKLMWYNKRSGTFEFATVDTICDQEILCQISFPLISVDRQKVIIEFQQVSNCRLDGNGWIDLYEKKNGHWVPTKVFAEWISDNRKWKYERRRTTTANSMFALAAGSVSI